MHQEEVKSKVTHIRKLELEISQKNIELSELKASIIELATVATSKNIGNTLHSLQINEEMHAIPLKYLSTFIELIHENLLKNKITNGAI